MAICKSCGVDLGEGNEKCPLCEATENNRRVVSPADVLNISKLENGKQLFELTILLLFSGIIITVAIDAAFGKGMNWSLFTTTCIGYVMTVITALYFWHSRPYPLILSGMISTLLLLFLIDNMTGNSGWFITVAGPVAFSLFVLAGLVVFLNSLSLYKGLNLIALILMALGGLMLVIEFLVDRAVSGNFSPQWSVVTAASLSIIALILIFVHYRLKRGRSLGRLFHV
ncbi:MAG TPA: DUF6320 domain-containing protein [Bacteroidales bacterium]|nr:DUF6320 domain-containing protein [Bacteroidales bacterium]